MYSDRIREILANPFHIRVPDEFTHSGTAENPICGDIATIFLNVQEGHIHDVGFQVHGCSATIAACHELAELIQKKSLSDLHKIDSTEVLSALGSLPVAKVHGVTVALDALHAAFASIE